MVPRSDQQTCGVPFKSELFIENSYSFCAWVYLSDDAVEVLELIHEATQAELNAAQNCDWFERLPLWRSVGRYVA